MTRLSCHMQANTVKAAAAGETPRQRHKRQRLASSVSAEGPLEAVQWMSWGRQKRAFQCVPWPNTLEHIQMTRVLCRLLDRVVRAQPWDE